MFVRFLGWELYAFLFFFMFNLFHLKRFKPCRSCAACNGVAKEEELSFDIRKNHGHQSGRGWARCWFVEWFGDGIKVIWWFNQNWLVVSTHLTNIRSKWESSPNRGENEKISHPGKLLFFQILFECCFWSKTPSTFHAVTFPMPYASC